MSRGPIRLMVFPERPECLVAFVPEGTELSLPNVTSPFTRKSVADCLGGLDFRVTESTPGRWTESFMVLRKAARAERAQRQKQAEALQAQLLKGGTQFAQDRAAAVEQKHVIDARIRDLKVVIGKAKSRAFTHYEYMDAGAYRGLESELKTCQERSLALQAHLGELRRKEQEEDRQEKRDEARLFQAAAHAVLSEEQLALVYDELANQREGDDE